MSAFLYYGCSSSVMSDSEYDVLSEAVAARWSSLTPFFKETLESAEAIRASGHHILISSATYHGALAWYEHVFGDSPAVIPPWREDARWKCEKTGQEVPLMAMPG